MSSSALLTRSARSYPSPLSSTSSAGFLRELRAHLVDSIRRFRSRGEHYPAIKTEATALIVDDLDASLREAGREAHQAEVYDLEAERLIAVATDPASPGGAAITPAELVPIKNVIRRSAELDHDLTEQLPTSA